MGYKSTYDCLIDLERNGHLIRIAEEVDPHLEMAAIHMRIFENNGPAIYFENVKGSKFGAVSNLFGTLARSKFMFRDTLENIQKLIELKGDPIKALKSPLKNISVGMTALKALPRKSYANPVLANKTTIDKLPLIKCWPNDGGAFVTLPLVYTEDIEKPGVMNSNLGMYRIQLNGNDYELNKEVGLHYQLHRGIGVHQSKANAKGQPLKVSIFVGGPPSHILAGVMPLPEGISELTFAGAIGDRRFKYTYQDGYCISSDADFVITGEVYPNENKPEGPFGDHLGYYSLKHDFPVMRVTNVYHRKDAIWPFTVVGRPPQEDTQFSALIHEITGDAIPQEIPGLHEINAVDAAGVHPLLFAIGSERYTPYIKDRMPAEILTIANHILGTGQLSLAKYLFIIAKEDDQKIRTSDPNKFLKHLLERVDWTRDLHFQTNTTIDTLDYSGEGLNSGSKLVIAAAGEKRRELANQLPDMKLPIGYENPKMVMAGVLAITGPNYIGTDKTSGDVLGFEFRTEGLQLVIIADDSEFTSANMNNFLWTTFTKSNPSHDIHGVMSFTKNKHWGCKGPLVIDARTKPHHAPALQFDSEIEKRVDKLGGKGKPLHGYI